MFTLYAVVHFTRIQPIAKDFSAALALLARATPKAVLILTIVAVHNSTRRATPKAIFILTVVAVHNSTRALERTQTKFIIPNKRSVVNNIADVGRLFLRLIESRIILRT